MTQPPTGAGGPGWRCDGQRDCLVCAAGRTCDQHWCHLLATAARHVFLQCPRCRHRWCHDTRFGADDRPAGLTDLSDFPGTSAA